MIGGVGKENLASFYTNHFIFTNPDISLVPVSRTVGNDQLVDEMIIKMVHDKRVDWVLPGVEPTGKTLEFPLLALVRFKEEDGKWKLAHEHIYWDQATILVQAGLLDKDKYDVTGAEQARKVVDPKSEPS